MRKLSWKKIVAGVFWLFAGIGTIVLFGAAMQKKRAEALRGYSN